MMMMASAYSLDCEADHVAELKYVQIRLGLGNLIEFSRVAITVS